MLVIDDDPDLRELVCTTLALEGYAVHGGDDGEALALAVAHRPDAILLDLLMPDPWSGEAVRAALLTDTRTASIPVILFTASDRAQEMQAKLACVALLRKPYMLEGLLETVARVVGKE